MTFDDAVEWAGSQSELSRRLGVTRQAVSKWKGKLPEHHKGDLRAKMLADGWFYCERCKDMAPLHRDDLCDTCHEDMNG